MKSTDRTITFLTFMKYGSIRNSGSTNVTKSILSIGITSLSLKNDLKE